jgi:hypothetical protein
MVLKRAAPSKLMNQDQPYTSLPANAFWKTGVAELDALHIDLAWQPKSFIDRATKIITVGSCFAQHISKALKANGFSWLDSEPAPAGLPPAEHAKHSYGVFSFRTGNIYTAALLRQWVSWSTSEMELYPECFVHGERVFDPFRPSLTEEGFDSVAAMLAARRATLAAIVDSIKQADLFIFTLGLTEAWLNKDGTVYPMCPGTLRGEFSAADHLFHNYSVHEVVNDLNCTFDELRAINPNLRFLLTVSPVPLTATASGQHVLTATTYSKSVLRSAAGELFLNRADTDYFPSYELITAPVFKGQFFEQNQRQVTPLGVAFVMGQFLTGIGANQSSTKSTGSANAAPARVSNIVEKDGKGTEICDDIILDTWITQPVDNLQDPPKIVLIGDSHMGMLSKVLSARCVRHAGGATMNASDWQAMRFDIDSETVFRPHNPEQLAHWKVTFNTMAKGRSFNDASKPVCITNLGMQCAEAWSNGFLKGYLPELYGAKVPALVRPIDLQNYLLLARRVHVGLVCRFLAMNYKVIVVSDPPMEPPAHEAGRTATDGILLDLYKSVGCQVFNARDWIKSLGGLPNNFRGTDSMHGSDKYYWELQERVFCQFSIKPQQGQSGPNCAPEELIPC